MRIRHGLYLILDPLETPTSFSMDKILVGSKIRKRYYLGYYTALEFYGCAYSAYNEMYVCIDKQDRLDSFECANQRFVPVFTKDIASGVEAKKYLGQRIYVSSRERTFLDCVNKPKYAGRWEECLKSLEGLSGVNGQKIYRLLHKFDSDFLYRKTGFILELLRDHSR
ncbi:MAG: hypothetical protein EF806_00905 [Candidatus Methanoliparum thermophilum]|uniref:Uncharacterized protein n=1 Tax=Methanoliparum thermophilum TaxID=2491083 RepID=A0A520KTR7_METT2|nr:type IV toxin-antitoxin system AbiEi family antitoxin [Candidatus Methanoliparum sp. LAM-1]RZN65483.1 MAG: hypothetical protein EF806_00905 [Candidatus Methanoliparum thermophilum]